MKIDKCITVFCGDLRQFYLARLLGRQFAKVYIVGFDSHLEKDDVLQRPEDAYDALHESDIVILPLPISCDGIHINAPLTSTLYPLERVLSRVAEHATVFGGMVSEPVERCAGKYNLEIIDYFDREELTVLNAVPTACAKVQRKTFQFRIM